MDFSLKGIINKPKAIGIRSISVDIFVESGHDPACALRGVQFLSAFAGQYEHGLLMFDHEGSGKEGLAKDQLQKELNNQFTRSSWGERAKAVVISPELEAWVWSDSPHVEDVAGWRYRNPGLRPWLIENGWLQHNEVKPEHPKEAFVAALREAKISRSASLYHQIAERVSFRRCLTNPSTSCVNC